MDTTTLILVLLGSFVLVLPLAAFSFGLCCLAALLILKILGLKL